MYSRTKRTSKNPAAEQSRKNPFAPKPFTVQPQMETGTQPEATPDAQTQQEQAHSSTSNWPDVSMFTYRRPDAPPPRVQMKLKIGKSGEQDQQEVVSKIDTSSTSSVQPPIMAKPAQQNLGTAEQPQSQVTEEVAQANALLQADGIKAPKPPNKVQEIKKAIAAKNAKQVLTILAGASDSEFTLLVQSFTAANTRWFLENLPKANTVANQAQVIQRFKGERSAQEAIALEGKLYWAGSSGSDPNDNYQIRTTTVRPNTNNTGNEENKNEFAVWIRGGKEPTDASKMNCWEAILYSAYRAGVLTKKWLVDVHKEAANEGLNEAIEVQEKAAPYADEQLASIFGKRAGVKSYNKVLEKYLGFNNAQPLTDKNRPKRGDIVFLNGLDHVVISLGTVKEGDKVKNQVMSLWIFPRDGETFSNTFQKTTIEDINNDWNAATGKPRFDVRFAPNPF